MKIVSSLVDKNTTLKLEQLLADFNQNGEMLSDGNRNTIKTFDLEGRRISIKAFKIPNAVNRIAYRFFRKSKAQRSYEYAVKLLEKGIGTPAPLAYAEEENLLFGKSFYLCDFLEADLTFRDLIENPKYGNDTEILKAFTAFTFGMHEKSVHFLDHSPGNTLIVKQENGYDFYLVDLNRMEFRPMDFETRIKNFSRLTPKKDMVIAMAREYARLGGYDEQKAVSTMWNATLEFQRKFHHKQKLKRTLKFWKK